MVAHAMVMAHAVVVLHAMVMAPMVVTHRPRLFRRIRNRLHGDLGGRRTPHQRSNGERR